MVEKEDWVKVYIGHIDFVHADAFVRKIGYIVECPISKAEELGEWITSKENTYQSYIIPLLYTGDIKW